MYIPNSGFKSILNDRVAGASQTTSLAPAGKMTPSITISKTRLPVMKTNGN